MIEVRQTKHHGCCNNCGVVDNEKKIFDIRFSRNGQGFNAVMLCESCIRELRKKLISATCRETCF